MNTPGVYIQENSNFPQQIAQVETAIPAFIGYTETYLYKKKSFRNIPTLIKSMAEFRTIFGLRSETKFDLVKVANTKSADVSIRDRHFKLSSDTPSFQLYQSMEMFFLNGGGSCYIVSVGNYEDGIDEAELLAGIESLVKQPEPTLLVIPDAVSLQADDCQLVQEQMLIHCGSTMKNRFAILDVHNGFEKLSRTRSINKFRELSTEIGGSYAAAYYPWINTTLLEDTDINFTHLTSASRNILQKLIQDQLQIDEPRTAKLIDAITSADDASLTVREVDKAIRAISPDYLAIVSAIKNMLNLLPPSSAVAGLYTLTDNAEGVWKAPAGMSIVGAKSPAFNVSSNEQQDLNVDINGKSINVIRQFAGEGTLVWGARTLDGNSLDWRYVSVRRTVIMLEQSIMQATKNYVFEPNDANTWLKIRAAVANFLSGMWRRGGLAGTTVDSAFSVQIGLGETMTNNDILEGLLRVNVSIALVRPAEFIVFTVEQKQASSN